MSCNRLNIWLEGHPGDLLPAELREHLAQCPECRELWQEQSSLEQSLRILPRPEVPPYFQSRIKAQVVELARQPHSSWVTPQAMVPIAALAVIVLAMVLLYRFIVPIQQQMALPRPGGIEQHGPYPVAPGPSAPRVPDMADVSPVATQIYPVWPCEDDVVEPDDLSIVASLYPAPPQGTSVRMRLDDADVSDRITVANELISYTPDRLGPGSHLVTITLSGPDGAERTVSFSFFAVEDKS